MTLNYLRLKGGTTNYLQDSVSENLKYSVIDFYRWAFLEVGAYQNITRSPAISGVFGGDKFRLAYVDDPRYTNGTTWQGFRGDWVWETGVSYNPNPTGVSVYLNGTLQPSSGYYVDYPRGRIVFSAPVSTGAVVNAQFSHRLVSFVSATEPYFRELMFNSIGVEREDFLASNNAGNWSQLADNRLQLPVVGVEIVSTPRYKPYQIGGGQWEYPTILYYIFAENESERDKIKDIIGDQNDSIIWTYNRNLMKNDPRWPMFLDSRGTPVSGFLTYPSVVSEANNFRFLNAKFINTHKDNIDTKNGWLYGAVVATTAEIINPYG